MKPPAIISVFIGEQLTKVLAELKALLLENYLQRKKTDLN
jgi:glutamine synthetase type III